MTVSTGSAEPIGGRYEIVRRLADGGEADVYLARDQQLELDVVLKVRPIINVEHLGRLRREASLLMRLVAHPGLPLVRSDLVEDDHYYLISDFVDGNDLRTLVGAQAGRGLRLSTVLDLVDEIAATLDHLHHHRPAVIHGDVKPENLVVDGGGRVVLVDFGAALRVGDVVERLGTPGFSAPEVLAGEGMSPASDVYSLAALTVFLLTAIVPKLGAAWPAALAHGDFAGLEGVLRRGLTWDPLGRPWSATEFASWLREAAETDAPTGTVSLLLIDGPIVLVGLIEAAGGGIAADVPAPAGCSVAIFSRPSDAVSVALELVRPGPTRIALHVGDLGGRHGATVEGMVNEAAGLLENAAESTVVCSPPVRVLLGGDDSLSFEPAATGFVVGIARASVRVVAAADPLSLRAERSTRWLASHRGAPLAGRDHELTSASSAIAAARSAGLASIVVGLGEAGMGKTRLLVEVAAEALEQGEPVFVGGCTEAGGAFEPFLDAFGDELLQFEVGALELDDEGWMDRRRFFAGVADRLRDLGGPVTLLIDDLQWIDGSTRALIAQLIDELGAGLTLLATCRPEVDSAVLGELTGRPGATLIQVLPLQPAAIAALAAGSGMVIDQATVEDLAALTGGNPFFCMQLLAHLRDVSGQRFEAADLSAEVRDWILRRVDRLGPEVRTTLAQAAVIGDRFEVITLAAVLEVSPLDVLTALDAATTAGLLSEGDHPGEVVFVHALVTAALARSLSVARQALLHAAIAQRLEEHGDDLANLESVMHHWFEADRLGDPLHAAEIAVEVASRSTERLGHERAVTVLDRALDLLGAAPASVDRQRIEARVRVAHARADFFASHPEQAMGHIYRAADLAEAADDPGTLAEAALLASLTRRHGLEDPELLNLLERASKQCPADPAVLAAMLHIRQARLLPASVAHDTRSKMARLGLRNLDRMTAIDRATVETEVSRACWSPDDAQDRVEVASRHIATADRQLAAGGQARWTGVLIENLNHRSAARLQLGRVGEALEDVDRGASIATNAGSTFLLTRLMMGQAMVRVVLGRHEEAEELSSAAVAMSDRHNLVLVQMAIAYGIARDRGQQAELTRLEDQVIGLIGLNPVLSAGFALMHAEADQLDDARRLLGLLAGFAPWPRNWLWLATTTAALEASVLVDDAVLVAGYTEDLAPYSGLWAIGGAEGACWGPVDRVLGLAAHSQGRLDDARHLLTTALHDTVRQGARPWELRCRAALETLPAPEL